MPRSSTGTKKSGRTLQRLAHPVLSRRLDHEEIFIT
jgi:hypothetical protein